MKSVIVAAGMSTRLRPLTNHSPKCLLPVGGKTILDRTVENLLEQHITQIAIVIGFEAQKIRSHMAQTFPQLKFRYIVNPNFATTNNAYSLLLAREFVLDPKSSIVSKESVLILDSDIVFHSGLLKTLCADAADNRIAVRVQGQHEEEEISVCVDTNRNVTKIGKHMNPKNIYGESIGIEVFAHKSAKQLYEILERRVRFENGRTEYYEAAFQEMIDEGSTFTAIDVSNYPAIEIDSPEDLERAQLEILPLIEKN